LVFSSVKAWAPVALAARRLWSRPGRVALAALGTAAAAALLATVLAAGLTVSDRAVARGISALPQSKRAIAASWGGLPPQEPAGGFPALDRQARHALTPLTGRTPAAFMLYRETRLPGGLVDLAAGDDLARWVHLRQGRLPRHCTPARCEVVQLAGAGPLPRPFVRVGSGSLGSQAPFGDLVGAETAGSIVARAERFHRPAAPPFVLAEGVGATASLRSLAYDYRSYRWVVPLRPDDVHPWNANRLIARVAAARASLGGSSGLFTVDAPEPELRAAVTTGRTAQRRLLLLGGEAAALLLAFTLLVASGLRRDSEANRRRLTWLGASRPQLALEAGAEAVGIAVVGTAVGWLAGAVPALFVARHFGSPGTAIVTHTVFSAAGIVVAAALAALAALILVLAVAAPPIRFGAMRVTALDVAALGALAAIAIAFARGSTDTSSLGAGQGTGAVLLLLPGLVVFVAAVVAARAVAVLPRALERLSRRGPLALRLSTLSLARNSERAAIAVAFLVVSLGLALFAAVYRSTLLEGQRDQANFAVPAAAIVREDYSKLVPVLDAAPLSTYDLFGGATPVIRLTGNVPGGAAFTLLAMPSTRVDRVSGWRASFSNKPLAQLGHAIAARRRVALRGVPLPSGRLELPLAANGTVRVRAALETPRGAFTFVELPHRVSGGRLLGFSFDISNRGLEREAISGEGAHPLGMLSLVLRAPRVDRRPLPVDFRRWRGTGGMQADVQAGTAHLRFPPTSDLQPRFRLRQPMDGRAVPVVVSPAVAAAAGPAGILPLDVEGTRVETRVVTTADAFPSVEGDVVLADRETLATAMNANDPGTAVTNEIWLGAPPPTRAPFDVLDVRTRAAVESRLAGDPLARGSLLALGVAAVAALALALGGLLLVIVSDLRDERGELFDLEAQGATPDMLRLHLRLRSLAVVGLGLVGGVATGAVLSGLVVSLVKVTAGGTEPRPPLVLSLDWSLVVAGLAAYLLLAAALVELTSRRAFRAPSAGRYVEVGW
jgi:hypothetical protein